MDRLKRMMYAILDSQWLPEICLVVALTFVALCYLIVVTV